ncbi:serpin family protein [Helcococcus kunzii]|uniref:serpin family protein n=1 Tax=Helcococcus kunzii TaxID=40091 RepID=UPI00389DA968
MIKKIKENKQVFLILILTFLLIISTLLAKHFLGDNLVERKAIAKAKLPEISALPTMKKYTNKQGEVSEKYYDDYDKWKSEHDKLVKTDAGYQDSYFKFFDKTKSKFLDLESKENQLYSPLNIYIAYSMLTETTEGNSREQLFTLLGQNDIEKLRKDVSALWRSNYIPGDDISLEMHNSIWLLEGRRYNKEVLDTISKKYYASTFSGKFGTKKYDNMMADWINSNTNNTFEKSLKNFETNENTVLSLISTIYLKDEWTEVFEKSDNDKKIFNTPNGEKEFEFMNKQFENGYFSADNSDGISLELKNTNSKFWAFLPKEGKTPKDILESDDISKIINSKEESEGILVNLSIPKFDINSQINLVEKTKELGVTDIFNPKTADFSELTNSKPFVSDIKHEARTLINEEGLEAAAYTIILKDESKQETQKEIDLVFNRPFVIVITGKDNVPLFTGIVNEPISE